MKKITLVLSALMLCVMMNAQQQVATLVHNGNVRIFYGANAFVDAHNEAVSGDAINLSSGVFNYCNITKNITLRGAGWSGSESTVIGGAIHVRIPSRDTVSNLYIEEIYFSGSVYIDSTLRSPYITKSRLDQLTFYKSFNGSIINCVIEGGTASSTLNANAIFVNSILKNTFSDCTAVNCVFLNAPSFSNRFNNCIFVNTTNSSSSIGSSNVAYNCVCCGYSTSTFFKHCTGSNNVNVGTSLSALFQNPSTIGTSYTDSTSFELTEAAKTQYLGDDGTEVGVYGGMMPFTTEPSFPRITRMNVGKKATPEGKLNVDIEVSSDEE